MGNVVKGIILFAIVTKMWVVLWYLSRLQTNVQSKWYLLRQLLTGGPYFACFGSPHNFIRDLLKTNNTNIFHKELKFANSQNGQHQQSTQHIIIYN